MIINLEITDEQGAALAQENLISAYRDGNDLMEQLAVKTLLRNAHRKFSSAVIKDPTGASIEGEIVSWERVTGNVFDREKAKAVSRGAGGPIAERQMREYRDRQAAFARSVEAQEMQDAAVRALRDAEEVQEKLDAVVRALKGAEAPPVDSGKLSVDSRPPVEGDTPTPAVG